MYISNKILYLVQGDNEKIYVTIIQPDGREYTMTNNDKLKMTVRKTIDSTDSVAVWSTTGVSLIELTRGDTANIDLGQNIYEIKLYKWADTAPTTPTQQQINNALYVGTIIPASTLICHPSIA